MYRQPGEIQLSLATPNHGSPFKFHVSMLKSQNYTF